LFVSRNIPKNTFYSFQNTKVGIKNETVLLSYTIDGRSNPSMFAKLYNYLPLAIYKL